mmetsp:Transcript_1368/g.3736  ORF Transcript_1368/g.3736 Transcript_1368/m.3736 type:complete len:88 (+) Transcript_1368:208-471(+)
MHDRSATISAGFDFLGMHYDVHQWFGDVRPQLAYGRRGGATRSAGIALAVQDGVYAIVTYESPAVSALIVSQLSHFLSSPPFAPPPS